MMVVEFHFWIWRTEKEEPRHHQKLSRLESTEIMENYAFIMGQTKWVEFLISGSAKPILDCENCTKRT